MKLRNLIIATLTLVMILAQSHESHAQMQRPGRMTMASALANLKPGQWVKLEGLVRKDNTVQCTEMKILTGDFMDDDWQVTGIVNRIDKEKKELNFLGLPVKINEMTRYKEKESPLPGFDAIKLGMLLEVEGTFLKNGVFLADKIQNEAHKLLEKPYLKDEIEIRGRVEKVEAGRRTVTLMGILHHFTDKTQIKSEIK